MQAMTDAAPLSFRLAAANLNCRRRIRNSEKASVSGRIALPVPTSTNQSALCAKASQVSLSDLTECGIEPARSDQQLDQPRIGFGCRKWVGALDQHLDLPPGAPQLCRHREDLGLVRRARQ